MNSKRNALLALVVAVAIAVGLLGYRLIVLSDLPLSNLEIFAIAVPPLVFLVCLPILLRPMLLGPRKLRSQTVSSIDRVLMIGAMIVENVFVFIGLYAGHLWMMIAGIMVFPLFSLLRGPTREKGMQRGQFSLRRLFFMITFCAVMIGMMVAIDRWHGNAQRQNNENWLRNSRAIWDNARGKLPPGVYEQKMQELDEEAAKRGLN